MMKESSKSSDIDVEIDGKRIRIDLEPREWIIIGIVAIIVVLLLR